MKFKPVYHSFAQRKHKTTERHHLTHDYSLDKIGRTGTKKLIGGWAWACMVWFGLVWFGLVILKGREHFYLSLNSKHQT